MTFDVVPPNAGEVILKSRRGSRLRMLVASCPSAKCGKIVVSMGENDSPLEIVMPVTTTRPPVSSVVPEELRRDYNEAALVLRFSPNASAALSRRCLQRLLVTSLKAPSGKHASGKYVTLAEQIADVLKRQVLPHDIAENIDHLRNLGNFGAHSQEDVAGQVVDVEPEEALWTLDVLDSLFERCYVAPAKNAARRAASNAKNLSAGQPPAKVPPSPGS